MIPLKKINQFNQFQKFCYVGFSFLKCFHLLNCYHCLFSPQVRSRRDNLLGHPVVTSLLDHKWASYGRVFYYTSLLFYLIFLSFFTGFMLVNPPPFFVCNETGNNVTWCVTGMERWERWERGFSDSTLYVFGINGDWIIIVLSCLNLLKEVCITENIWYNYSICQVGPSVYVFGLWLLLPRMAWIYICK